MGIGRYTAVVEVPERLPFWRLQNVVYKFRKYYSPKDPNLISPS